MKQFFKVVSNEGDESLWFANRNLAHEFCVKMQQVWPGRVLWVEVHTVEPEAISRRHEEDDHFPLLF